MSLLYVFLIYILIGIVIMLYTFDLEAEKLSNGEKIISIIFLPSIIVFFVACILIDTLTKLKKGKFSSNNKFIEWLNKR